MPPNKLSRTKRRLERRRRDLERKRSHFLDFLRREVRYGNITRRRYEQKWKELLIKISLEKSREEVEYIWQTFDWTLDVKDMIISKLMDNLKKANDQSIRALENHNAQIEMFMNQYKKFLDCMHIEYLEKVEGLKAYYKSQEEEYEYAYETQQNVLKSVFFRMELETAQCFRDQMEKKYIFMESRKSEYLGASDSLENEFEVKIGKVWAKCNEAYDAYVKSYNKKIREFKIYCDSHNEAHESKDRNLATIVHLGNLHKILLARLDKVYNNYGQKLKSLTEKLERYRNILSIFVSKVSRDVEEDNRHIKLIVSCTTNALDHLERIVRKGEFLLKKMCCGKKYETLHEKVLPYPKEKSVMEEKKNIDFKLFSFNIKMSNVDSTRMTLNEERKFLKLENMQLRKKLENYCLGFQTCVNKNATYLKISRGSSVYRCRLPERALNNR